MPPPDRGANPPATAKASVFHIQLGSGIWSVKLDGKVCGDYRAQILATDGVQEKAHALRTLSDSCGGRVG